MFSDRSTIQLEISNKMVTRNPPYVWKLRNTLLRRREGMRSGVQVGGRLCQEEVPFFLSVPPLWGQWSQCPLGQLWIKCKLDELPWELFRHGSKGWAPGCVHFVTFINSMAPSQGGPCVVLHFFLREYPSFSPN